MNAASVRRYAARVPRYVILDPDHYRVYLDRRT